MAAREVSRPESRRSGGACAENLALARGPLQGCDMVHKPEASSCLVCAAEGQVRAVASRLSRVTVQGRTVILCREHASQVAAHMPKTWEELRAIFAGPNDRRSPIPRRVDPDDRRVFPPRPEGRRRSLGRRSVDPPND